MTTVKRQLWFLFFLGALFVRNSSAESIANLRRTQDDEQPSPGLRIINGADAREDRFPWIVWYFFNGEQCGGSMIAPDLALTNAHCHFQGLDLGNAYIGKWNTQDREEGGPVRPVVEYIPHPDYVVDETMYQPGNDVAILKLDRAPNSNFGVISLNFDPDFPSETGEELLLLGWGSTTNGADDRGYQNSDILQEGPTNYIAFEECAVASDPELGIAYGLSPENTGVGPDWLCTNDPKFAHCLGDSGGPIIRVGAGPATDLLVGVISGSSGGCDNQYMPQINQRVSYHIDWIKEVGCEKSASPPDEWNCPGAPTMAPTDRAPVPLPTTAPIPDPTGVPAVDPTAAPVEGPDLSLSPIESPTATTLPPNATPTDQPALISQPGGEPTISPVQGPDLQPDDEPSVAPTFSGDDDARQTEKVQVNVKIIFGDSPQDTGWFIADEAYARFRVAVPIGAYLPTETVVNDRVMVDGGERYMFLISNLVGNGLDGTQPGSYEVFLGEEFDFQVLASGTGDFGDNETSVFYVPCGEGVPCAPISEPTDFPSNSPVEPGAPTFTPISRPPTPTRAPNAPPIPVPTRTPTNLTPPNPSPPSEVLPPPSQGPPTAAPPTEPEVSPSNSPTVSSAKPVLMRMSSLGAGILVSMLSLL